MCRAQSRQFSAEPASVLENYYYYSDLTHELGALLPDCIRRRLGFVLDHVHDSDFDCRLFAYQALADGPVISKKPTSEVF
jgi:hypothetical protein